MANSTQLYPQCDDEKRDWMALFPLSDALARCMHTPVPGQTYSNLSDVWPHNGVPGRQSSCQTVSPDHWFKEDRCLSSNIHFLGAKRGLRRAHRRAGYINDQEMRGSPVRDVQMVNEDGRGVSACYVIEENFPWSHRVPTGEFQNILIGKSRLGQWTEYIHWIKL